MSAIGPNDRRPVVMLVGDWQAREFAKAVDDMRQLASVRKTRSPREAAQLLKAGDAPTHIVLAISRPGQISDAEVARLHRLCPLAHLTALLGTYCEGEMRTGAPLSGVTRVYWHQWRPRFFSETNAEHTGRLSFPRTYTIFDQSLCLASSKYSGPLTNASIAAPKQSSKSTSPATRSLRANMGRIAIGSERFSDVLALRDALQLPDADWANNPRNVYPLAETDTAGCPAWLVWDAGAWDDAERRAIDLAIHRHSPARTLLLLGWPRDDDVEQARLMGVTDVLSKPYLIDDLLTLMQRPLRLIA